jgi:type II secretory pathway component PulF
VFPLSINEQRPSPWRQFETLFQRPIKPELLSTNLSQLADLLENGVALLESLKILAEQSVHPRLQQVYRTIHSDIAEGASLEAAFAKHHEIFSPLIINTIRAGAEGGFLEESLRRIAGFLEKQAELRGKVNAAMAYPSLLAAVGAAAIIFVMVVLVPLFQQLFDRIANSGNGLPAITQIVLMIRQAFVGYGWLTLGVIVGLIVVARRLLHYPQFSRFMDRWKLKIPLFGEILHNASVSRFCRVLGTLLRNGVPLLKSLEIASESTGNVVLTEAIRNSAKNVTSGQSLSQPLANSGLVPPSVMAMIRVAEESNSLDSVLIKIADSIDQRVERKIDVMIRLIEPAMLLAIISVALFILLGLLLPVFDMSSALE